MTYKSHFAFSASISLAPVFIPNSPIFQIDPIMMPFVIVTIFIFSLAPDFDEPGSYLSRQFPFLIISHCISAFVKHRGATHLLVASLFILFSSYAALYFSGYDNLWYLSIFAFSAYILHSFGDGLTKSGVPRFFYPISNMTLWLLPKQLRFKTGSIVEYIIVLPFHLLFFYEAYFYITKIKNLFV